MSEALFCIENLRVAYPQRQEEALSWAIDDVSLTLQPGERMGLVGESGCGKSTLGRAAMRLLPPDSRVEGRVTFQGESVFDLMPNQMRKFRGEAIALIFQDPMTRLDPLMTIGKHCIETLQAHSPKLSTKEAKEQAIATLAKVNIPASRWNQYPHEFSGGMRQRVAIALALLLNPKLIVADEPTTSLDVTVSAQILQELTRLCSEENMALLLISHDLAMVGEYCDRIGVMYQGKIVEMGATETVLRQPQHEYTRSLLKAALHIQTVDEDSRKETSQSPILQITELQQHYTIEPNFLERLWKKQGETIKAVDGINLELYQGEIFGLVGESGCGKSTLSRTILQLIPPTAGKVEFLGQELTTLSRSEIRASRRQMQMIFQDPHACLNPVMTVGQSIADPLFIHNLADADKAKSEVLWMLEKVGLTPPELYYQRYPSDLSGGQQQRVAIARALITRPKLLICDEPVSMLDASVQSQVLDLMLELKVEFELTYLFITHDLWLARFLCDRIAVMHSGQIVEMGSTKQMFSNPQHPYTKTLLAAAPLLSRA
ncbi:dipeptide ABC transporter ATP-binding protein [Nodularia sphaerocarpa]|uniref:dipeptide ABC transporter ATP-binding protein n=1 Tax=Nodularia sphaerocarpa TaxID=137816 RepID=UPI001EFAB1AD|nr:ABC transporter ATP-binding protein [Nodularia sphaerocarpa]MDB9372982.1 ABC transporter ATP-binding protein [Nodularia sphaerocarpa CS-585]MDB9378325.1 ABC transporter ATP-binding protein [Nodularia sphaerocarpa CS-585A2]ULP71614.1 Glutathione import ATP-binding protein GsiA [Nodularia sphaerocarpa UHCC 0038]